MNPTGTIEDDGATLVVERRFPAPIHDVWAALTESDRLARWFGTWTGDPSTGSVMVAMTAEADTVPPARYDIEACEPPRRLSVHAVDDGGTWHLEVELSEEDGTTVVVFRQRDVDLPSLHDTGPGWEWYLDRWVAAVAGTTPPTLDEFEQAYLAMGPGYAAMVRGTSPGSDPA